MICIFPDRFSVLGVIIQLFCHSEINFTKVNDEKAEKRLTSVSFLFVLCLFRAKKILWLAFLSEFLFCHQSGSSLF